MAGFKIALAIFEGSAEKCPLAGAVGLQIQFDGGFGVTAQCLGLVAHPLLEVASPGLAILNRTQIECCDCAAGFQKTAGAKGAGNAIKVIVQPLELGLPAQFAVYLNEVQEQILGAGIAVVGHADASGVQNSLLNGM